jgi:hypothetical protein
MKRLIFVLIFLFPFIISAQNSDIIRLKIFTEHYTNDDPSKNRDIDLHATGIIQINKNDRTIKILQNIDIKFDIYHVGSSYPFEEDHAGEKYKAIVYPYKIMSSGGSTFEFLYYNYEEKGLEFVTITGNGGQYQYSVERIK